MKEHGVTIVDGSTWDVRIIALGALLLLCAILSIGTSFESKIMGLLLVIISASFVNYFIGLCIPTGDAHHAKGGAGLTGLSCDHCQYFRGTARRQLRPGICRR